jgi:hypothetical protein
MSSRSSLSGTFVAVWQHVRHPGTLLTPLTLLPAPRCRQRARRCQLCAQPDTPDPDPATLTLAQALSLHSRPQSSRKMFLAFNGCAIANSAWNSGRAATLTVPPYDTVSRAAWQVCMCACVRVCARAPTGLGRCMLPKPSAYSHPKHTHSVHHTWCVCAGTPNATICRTATVRRSARRSWATCLPSG